VSALAPIAVPEPRTADRVVEVLSHWLSSIDDAEIPRMAQRAKHRQR
jgi:hypothetical protein